MVGLRSSLTLTSASLLILSLAVYGSASEKVTVYPIADSSVDYGFPESNYGGLDVIGVANVKLSGTSFQLVARGYLMFELPKLPKDARIGEAALTIYVASIGSTTKVYVHFCPDSSWRELEINWRNAPGYVEKPLGVAVVARAMEFYSLDVTGAVEEAYAEGMDRLTLVLTSEEKPSLTDIIKFSSREANGEYRPRLEVTYSTMTMTTAAQTGETRLEASPATTILQQATAKLITTTLKETTYITVTRREVAPINFTVGASYSFRILDENFKWAILSMAPYN